jgi:hypothetical protein
MKTRMIGGLVFAAVLVLSVVATVPAMATHISCQGSGVPHQFLGGDTTDDQIAGDQNANVMAGLGGNDFIYGRGAGDTICGE